MTGTMSSSIPVTLLTGFLGSGKTTILNYLVQQPELADALVIINEFGAILLDHQLVAHSTDNVVMEMSSGCLCCTICGDLIKPRQRSALERRLNTINPAAPRNDVHWLGCARQPSESGFLLHGRQDAGYEALAQGRSLCGS
ncbi:putative metal chaperone, involved in Zn homeostasis, GTPase of COG0523 family [Candidatus Paraburkholderia calva]|nr:putative metal chaperone, involved in Zn homeostasis, GTPase of COG0523 family [Candidatus Paraburkholderia calva]